MSAKCNCFLLPITLLFALLLGAHHPTLGVFTVHTRTSTEREARRQKELFQKWAFRNGSNHGKSPAKRPILPINHFVLTTTETQPKPRNSLEEEQFIINRLLHSEHNAARELYDWRVRPRGNLAALPGETGSWGDHYDGPVLVDVNMYLRSISKVDDVNMEFTMHFTFRQEWIDERLYFASPTLKYIVLVASEHSQRIFLPDTFFQNEKDGRKHNVDKPNVFIRVHNGTGRVLYSSRMTLTLSCPMFLHAYPLDTQTCFIDYASYAYTTQDLEYRWATNKDPIQIKPGLHQSLPSFVLSSVSTGNCTSVTNTGTYSCLRTVLRLRREFSYYLLQLYVPSFMLVAVSTVSFWLDRDSVPARITLGTTVLLTVTTMASGINAKLPPVSYTKSVDIWIGVCTGFIFAALLEFSLVNWAARKELAGQARTSRMITNPLLSALHHRQEHQRRLSAMDSAAYGDIMPVGGGKKWRSPSLGKRNMDESMLRRFQFLKRPAIVTRLTDWWDDLWSNRYREKSRRIDLMARVLFPFFFILFNIIYWTAYLSPYLAEDIHAVPITGYNSG